MKFKRTLYLWHRWLGIAMCLLFAMWFFSGVVMMYVGFPGLAEEERLAGLPTLNRGDIALPPAALLDDAELSELRLYSVLGRPAYLARYQNGSEQRVFADGGEPMGGVDASAALVAARLFAETSGRVVRQSPQLTTIERIDYDQWSAARHLDRHRPLYRVDLHSADGLQLYVSSLTGEVLRDTSRHERVWNWLGANLHWLYPAALRRHGELWAQLVIGVSLLGLLSIISGGVLGIWRLRLRRPYKGKRYSPYRGVMKLHHVLGLCCLLVLGSYMFSGLMSMNPWGLFSAGEGAGAQAQRYRGRAEAVASPLFSLAAVQRALAQAPFRELRWQRLAGQFYLLGYTAERRPTLLGPQDWQREEVMAERIAAGAAMLLPGRRYTVELLSDHDFYYYSHHQRYRPLPVLRLRFDDDLQSWFHVDPHSGELLGRLNRPERLRRWLYNGLHSMDFRFFLDRRPLWDVLLISLMLLGFSFAVTALWIAARRLRVRRRRSSRGSRPVLSESQTCS